MVDLFLLTIFKLCITIHHLLQKIKHSLYTLKCTGGVLLLIKDDNKRITITLPKDLYELIKEGAEYEDKSMSYVILRILKRHYKIKTDDEK